MKTITIPSDSVDVNTLLENARDEDVLVRTADGEEFIVTAVDEFDRETARTRNHVKLMELLDHRARKVGDAVSLDEAKRQLGLDL